MRRQKRMGRIYRARNGVTEEVRFTMPATAKVRAEKSKCSTPRKAEQNKNQAAHVLGRILNNNFEQGDLFLTLEYTAKERKALEQRARARVLREREKAGHDLEGRTAGKAGEQCSPLQRRTRVRREELEDAILLEVDADATLFVRRCRAAGLAGTAKIVTVPSDRDGSTGKPAAPHVHFVLSGDQCVLREKQMTLCGRSVAELWGKGPAEYEFLRGGAYNKLAAYLIRQTRQIANRRKYRCSRSIERIIPEEFEIDPDAGGEIRVPAGAEVMERQDNAESRYHMQYVRYLPKERSGIKARSGDRAIQRGKAE